MPFAEQKHEPVNPSSHEGAHEGPRGYAHALKEGATFVVLDEHGDCNRDGNGYQGLYHGDTRTDARYNPADLAVGDGTIDLVVYRRAGKVAVAVARNDGRLQIQIVP